MIFHGFLAFLAALNPGVDLDNPVILLDEGHGGLTYPFDAVYAGGRLFVTDQDLLFIVYDGKSFRQLGRRGSGPEEFEHHPEELSLSGDRIVVREMYGWSQSTYGLDGRFLGKEALTRPKYDGTRTIVLEGREIRQVSRETAIEHGFLYEDGASGNRFGKLAGNTQRDYHLESAFLHLLPDDGILVLKRRGLLEIYAPDGKLSREFAVPLLAHARDVEKDKLANLGGNPHGHVYYLYGLPVKQSRVCDNHAWLLVATEATEIERGIYAEIWLYVLRLADGKLRQSARLDAAYNRMRITDGHLVLISKYDARIAVYAIAE